MSGWKSVSLSDVVTIFNGKTPSKAEQRNEGHPVLKIRDVSEFGRFRGKHESFVDPVLADKYSTKQIRDGDTLILNAAHNADYVGSKTYRAEPPVFGSLATGEWLIIRPLHGKLDASFVYHWVTSKSTRSAIRNVVNGIHLYPKDVARLNILVPSLPEQRRIACILDKADALRTKRREALAQLDRLAQSIFVEMFGDPVTNPTGWPRHCLGELIEEGPQNGLYKSSADYGSGTPILRIDAFYDGVVTKLDTLKRVRLSTQDVTLFGLHEGDIVINRVNSIEYLGKSALIPKLLEPTVFESNMMRFRVKRDAIDPEYVIHFLQTGFIKSQIFSGSKNAVNQSSINQKDVKGFLVNVPPLRLQQTFGTRIQAVEALKAHHRQASVELDSLFKSLQHRAFQGEL